MWACEPEQKDVAWWQVVVERKTIQDLLASLPPGDRVERFLDRTGGPATPERRVRALLLVGDTSRARTFGHRDWSAADIDQVLVAMQQMGVITLHATVSDWADRLARFWRYTADMDQLSGLLSPQKPMPDGFYLDTEHKEKVRALMGLPGWGEHRAKEALKELGSVGKVLEAVMERRYQSFQPVKGVGKGVVDTTAKFMEEQW